MRESLETSESEQSEVDHETGTTAGARLDTHTHLVYVLLLQTIDAGTSSTHLCFRWFNVGGDWWVEPLSSLQPRPAGE